VLIARHDGTRPAHAQWRLNNVIEWELGSRRSDSPSVGASRCNGAGSCRLVFGPEQGGACENDYGRERSDSAEQGFSSHVTREVSTGAKSSTGSERPLHDVPRHGASVDNELDRSRCALRRVI